MSDDPKPEKPPFAHRHPYWNAFLLTANTFFSFITLVGYESIDRLDVGVIFAYIVIFGSYMFMIGRFVGNMKPKDWKRLGYFRRFCFGCLVIVFSMLWFGFFAVAARFIPPITISREITFLTEPRNDDGWIDFAAGFEQQFLPPIPPEQNGYRLLAAALGKSVCDSDKIADKHWLTLCEKLGLDPDLVPTVILGEPNPDADILRQIRNRLWTRDEFPEVAAWLDDQVPLFDVLAESVRKEHFAPPVIPAQHVDRESRFDMELFEGYGYNRLRNLGTRLAYRISLHLGSGNEQDALDDLETLYRLASVCRIRLHHSMQLYTPLTLESLANELSLQWLWTANPDDRRIAEWEARRKAVIESAPVSGLVMLLRFQALHHMKCCADVEYLFDKNEPDFWWKKLNFSFLRYAPWNRHLYDLNRHFDACDAAMNSPYRGTLPIMDGLFTKTSPSFWDFVKHYFWKGGFGLYIGFMTETSSGSLFVDSPFDPYFLLAADDCCTETAFALEHYHRRHGNYPASLDILQAAGFVAEIPLDPCARHARPLQYRLEKEGGYTLYNVGRNGMDDDGMNYHLDTFDDPQADVPKSADDWRVRRKL